jgi:queuine tRNA-ribosyltransferase
MIYTSEGVMNIKNEKWKNDFSPIDPACPAPTSTNHTRAYLRHLIRSNEILGFQLATLQNLSFYLWLVKEARKHILAGDFHIWQPMMLKKVKNRL